MTPEELHRKKLKEIGYKDLEIERFVLKYMTNCTYEFAEAYHAEQLLIQRVSQRSEPLIDIHGYHGDLNGSCLTCGLPEGCHEL